MNTSADRDFWLGILERLSRPVLGALAEGRLRASMPVEHAPGVNDREGFTYLEALGRLLTGIAPWLEGGADTGEEGVLRHEIADLARRALAAGTDPASPDFLNFTEGHQPIVDAAFLSHALLRAPEHLWNRLDDSTRANVVRCLKATRSRKPGFNNWLLFSAMIEAALCRFGEDWDRMRVDYAIRQHEQWYKGDGVYGDGPSFHWDYYNSFVIQPMLLDVLETVSPVTAEWQAFAEPVLKRMRRYAAVQERLISPEGTFPPIGRSLAYRFGAFQVLAQMALRQDLPEGIAPAQARCALTAVIRRTMEAPGTFDDQGWLRIGFCGRQPGMGETYISTGSTYLCAAGLLPLGLPPEAPFWSDPPALWSAARAWAGEDIGCDHAI